MAENEQTDLTALTVQLLSAYVANNQVPNDELPKLIAATREALGGRVEPEAPPPQEYSRAVSVKASTASPDHIISMIDGRPYKSLRRHLKAAGLTPAEYIARYKLPKDYPMVAPGYSAQRREVAKKLGLGRKPRAAPTSAPVETTPDAPTSTPARAKKAAAKPATPKTSAPGRKAAGNVSADGDAKPAKAKARANPAKRKRAAAPAAD